MGADGVEAPVLFPGRPGGFTPDGSQLCTSALGRFEVRDAMSGDVLWGSTPEAGEVVRVVPRFAGRVVAITAGGTVIIYDAQTHAVLNTWRDRVVRDAQITEDGKALAVLDIDGRVAWIDLVTGSRIDISGGHHLGGGGLLTLTGIDVATYNSDGFAKFWRPDVALNTLGHWQGAGTFSRVQGIAAATSTTRILLSKENGEVMLSDGASGSVLSAFSSPALPFPRPLTASRDGALFAFSPDGFVTALLATDAPDSLALLPGSEGLLSSLALSGDHSRVAAATNHGVVSFWQTETREALGTVACGDADLPGMVYLDSAETLVAASANGRLYKISGSPAAVSAELDCGSPLRSVDYAPLENLLAVGLDSGVVQLHDATTLEKVSEVQAGRDSVYAVRFDASGKRLFSSSSLATLLWLIDADRKMHDVGLKLDGMTAMALSGASDDMWCSNLSDGLEVLRTASPGSVSPLAQPVAALSISVASQQQALANRVLTAAPTWLDTPLPVTLPAGAETELLGKWGFRSGDQITAISSAKNGALGSFKELLTLFASGENKDSPLVWEGIRADRQLRGRMTALPVAKTERTVSLPPEECAQVRATLVAAIGADAPQLRAMAYRQSSLLLGYPPAAGELTFSLPDVSNTPLQPLMPRLALSVYDQILEVNGAPPAGVPELQAAFESLCADPAKPLQLTVGRGYFNQVHLSFP